MAKTFYTDRDIEDLAKQGVKSLVVNDDVVLTDLARDKARRLGIELLSDRDAAKRTGPASASGTPSTAPRQEASPSKDADLEGRIFASVKARLGDQVDDTLLRAIVQRVINSLRRS